MGVGKRRYIHKTENAEKKRLSNKVNEAGKRWDIKQTKRVQEKEGMENEEERMGSKAMKQMSGGFWYENGYSVISH